MKRKWRLYLDTSVFGGCFDEAQGWAEDSQRLLDGSLAGTIVICFSDTVVRELENAPGKVQELWNRLPAMCLEQIGITKEIESLCSAYIEAGVLGKASLDDAMHVAAATVARVDAIVSWNFKHIVRLDKIKGFNQINLSLGYGIITVVNPKEVNFDE